MCGGRTPGAQLGQTHPSCTVYPGLRGLKRSLLAVWRALVLPTPRTPHCSRDTDSFRLLVSSTRGLSDFPYLVHLPLQPHAVHAVHAVRSSSPTRSRGGWVQYFTGAVSYRPYQFSSLRPVLSGLVWTPKGPSPRYSYSLSRSPLPAPASRQACAWTGDWHPFIPAINRLPAPPRRQGACSRCCPLAAPAAGRVRDAPAEDAVRVATTAGRRRAAPRRTGTRSVLAARASEARGAGSEAVNRNNELQMT